MGSNLRTKDSIINGESEGKTFYEIITDSEALGWRTFDASLLELYKNGSITEDTAMAYASRKPIIGRGIDQIKSSKGIATTDIEGLNMDRSYEKSAKPKKGRL